MSADDPLKIPTFLKRNKDSIMTKPEVNSQDDESTLESQAFKLTSAIAALDEQATAIKTERSAKHKELRAITSRLVTIKLKSKKS